MHIIERRCLSQEITISRSYEVFYITNEVYICVDVCVYINIY